MCVSCHFRWSIKKATTQQAETTETTSELHTWFHWSSYWSNSDKLPANMTTWVFARPDGLIQWTAVRRDQPHSSLSLNCSHLPFPVGPIKSVAVVGGQECWWGLNSLTSLGSSSATLMSFSRNLSLTLIPPQLELPTPAVSAPARLPPYPDRHTHAHTHLD